MHVVHLDHQRLFLEAIAATGLTGAAALVLAQLLTHPVAVGLAVAAVHVVHQSLKRPRRAIGARAVVVDHGDGFFARAVEDDVLVLRFQLIKGRIEVKAVVGADRVQRLHVVLGRRVRPGRQRAFAQGQAFDRHDQVGVKEHLVPQTITGRAGAKGVVEGEEARLDLVDGEAAHRTGELCRKGRAFFGLGVFDDGEAVGQLQRGFEAVGQALFHAFFQHHAVDHHFDGVLEFLVQRWGFFDEVHDVIDLHALETALLQLGQLLLVLTLAATNDGGQQVEARAFAHLDGLVDHLADGLAFDRQARCG